MLIGRDPKTLGVFGSTCKIFALLVAANVVAVSLCSNSGLAAEAPSRKVAGTPLPVRPIKLRNDLGQLRAAVTAAARWMNLLKKGRYRRSWKIASPIFKSNVSITAWESQIRSIIGNYGTPTRLRLLGVSYLVSHHSLHSQTIDVLFLQAFKGKSDQLATVTLESVHSIWRVSGFHLKALHK